jgi:riboflavin biosynthesis pyrimidine reductase
MTAPTRLQQLVPEVGERDIEQVYGGTLGPAHDDRPHVTVNMVSSVDGAVAVAGRSSVLSSPPDRAVFHLLRSLADVVLVGAGTVRAESYGTVKVTDDVRAARLARGQAPAPALAVVTRSIELDWSAPLFTAPTRQPFVVAPANAPHDRVARARAVATVIQAGSGEVDLAEALRVLRHDHGVASVLCEGGPTLNAQLAGGLIDQLCLTLSPTLVGGGSQTILAHAALPAPLELTLASMLVSSSQLFLRYLVS